MCCLERFSACFKGLQKRVPELPTVDGPGYPWTPVTPELEVQQTDPGFSRRRHSSLAARSLRAVFLEGWWHSFCALALSQSSVPPALFQDSTRCDLSSFALSEEEAAFSRSQQHTGRAFQLQQREGHGTRPTGEPGPRVNSPVLSREASPGPAKALPPARHSMVPLVILRKKRGQASPLAAGDSSTFLFADFSSSTPKRSPVRGLPFSPSQVDHNLCTAVTNFQQTPEP